MKKCNTCRGQIGFEYDPIAKDHYCLRCGCGQKTGYPKDSLANSCYRFSVQWQRLKTNIRKVFRRK